MGVVPGRGWRGQGWEEGAVGVAALVRRRLGVCALSPCHSPSPEVAQAGWSPDGRQIVSVGKDCCICVWNFFG